MKTDCERMKTESVTAKYSKYAKADAKTCSGSFVRVFRLFRGQDLLLDKVEKNGISPKIPFARLPFPAASQSVALSSTDCWDGGPKANGIQDGGGPNPAHFRVLPHFSA
jgi:hypothetical protein